jgi:hypothetical protein
MTYTAAPFPPDLPSAAPERRGVAAPEDVWEAVRRDYLSGLSAPACCRRHGVGLTALRDRASREGWRRADQPWTPPNRLDPEDEGVKLEEAVGGNLDRVPLRELSFVAFRRMMRAVMRGDAAEALRWRRVRQALDQEEAELERQLAQEESIRRYYAPAASTSPPFPDPPAPDGSDGSDGSDGVSAPAPSVIPRPPSGPGDPEPHDAEADGAPADADPDRAEPATVVPDGAQPEADPDPAEPGQPGRITPELWTTDPIPRTFFGRGGGGA